MTSEILSQIESAAIAAKSDIRGSATGFLRQPIQKAFQFQLWRDIMFFEMNTPENWRAELRLRIATCMGAVCVKTRTGWGEITKLMFPLIYHALSSADEWIKDQTISFTEFRDRYTALMSYLA